MTKLFAFTASIILLANTAHASLPCAAPHTTAQQPSDYARSLGIKAIVHGSSFNTALKVISSGALLSSRQVARDSGVFTDENPAPLSSIFFQALYKDGALSEYANPETGFEVVFAFRFPVLDRYDFYAKPGWDYDQYAHCISSDLNSKNGSLKAMLEEFERRGRSKDSEANEIMIRSRTGVSLSFLSGIYVPAKFRKKIEKALLQKGLAKSEVNKLLNGRGDYQGNLPIPELSTEDVEAICQAAKGSRVLWEDLAGNQPYLKPGAWNEFLGTKSAKVLNSEFRGRELLVRTPSAYRLHIRVESVSKLHGTEFINYTSVDKPAGNEAILVDDPLIVGLIENGVANNYCRVVSQE